MINMPHRLSFRTLFAIALILIVVSVSAIGFTVWNQRADAIEDAYTDTGNIAVVLSEQLNRSIQSIDIVMTEVRERLEPHFPTEIKIFPETVRREETYRFLQQRLAHLSQAGFIGLIDKDGQLAATTQTWPSPTTNLSDRDYFQHFKHGDDKGVYISKLEISRVSGAQTIFFSKRIGGANNEFLGIVLVGIRLSYFEHTYNSISLLRDQSFLLVRRDGTVLIRHPDTVDRSNQKMPSGSPWYKIAAEGGGHYRSPGYFDGAARLVAVRALPEYPLVIDVAVSESAALATWYRRTTWIALGTLLALICSALLLKLLRNQFGRLIESQRLLAERERTLTEKTNELQLANFHIDAALHNMSQGLSMFDGAGRLVLWNERYIRMYNLSSDLVVRGITLSELLTHRKESGGFMNDPSEYDAKIRSAVKKGIQFTITGETSDGRIIEVTNEPTADGGWVATHEEVTERKRAEAKIAHLAHHDVLTGLPNRAAFNEFFAATLARSEESDRPFALMSLDLDRFKSVNDLFGHALGDSLLCEVSARLRCVAGGAFLARIGGDEFSFIVTGGDVVASASQLAKRITTILSDGFELRGRKLAANASMGVAVYPHDAPDGEILICNADAALYRAKSDGPGSCRFFEPEMDRQLRESREIQHELSSALAKNEFRLVYQPEALIDGSIIGFEALLRWHHPVRGLVPPSTFIPLAEDGGLIVSIGEWVLRNACREAATWKSGILLAVNLSPAQFSHGNLPGLVHSILLETGLLPSRLELEITEGILIDDFGRAQAILRQLKSLGVKIALDDFGTGYSSLSYLQSFPFDKVKIDRSFISDLETNKNNAAIVRAAITLTRSLKLPVLAEGVETDGQRLFLRKEGCDQIQGYLIGRPLAIKEYEALVSVETGAVLPHSNTGTSTASVSRQPFHAGHRRKSVRKTSSR